MRRTLYLLLASLLLSTSVAAVNLEVQPYKGWLNKCITNTNADFPALVSEIGEGGIESECAEYVEMLAELHTERGLVAVLGAQLSMAGCYNNLKSISTILHPILVCKNLVEKQIECEDELKVEGEAHPVIKCALIKAIAVGSIKHSPELSGDALANASLQDIIKLHLVDKCLEDAQSNFPDTWDDIGEGEATVQCTDWVEYLINTTEEYSLLSLFHISVRMAGCYRYMRTLPNVTSPIVRCKNLVMNIKSCVDDYEEQGKSTDEALRLCDTEAIHQAIEVKYNPQMLDQMFPAGISESRRARIEEYIEQNPVMGDFLANLDESQRNIYMHLTRAQQKELLQEGIESAKARLARMRLRLINEAMRFKLRVIDAVRLRRIHQTLERRRRIYLSLLQNHSIAKQEFLDLKQAEKEACEEDNSSAGCLEAINSSIEHAKGYLNHIADLQIIALGIVRDKVESSEYIEEEKVQEILGEIDSLLVQLNESKAILAEADTKDEVKSAAALIRSSWVTIRNAVVRHNRLLKRAALRIIIRRAKAWESRIESALSRLSAERRARVKALLEQFSQKVKEAEGLVEDEGFDEGDLDEILGEISDAQDILDDIGDESAEGEVTISEEEDEGYEVVEENEDE